MLVAFRKCFVCPGLQIFADAFLSLCNISHFSTPSSYPHLFLQDSSLPLMKPVLILPTKWDLLFVHWFIQQTYIECLLCSRHCSGHQGLNGRHEKQIQSCLLGAYILHRQLKQTNEIIINCSKYCEEEQQQTRSWDKLWRDVSSMMGSDGRPPWRGKNISWGLKGKKRLSIACRGKSIPGSENSRCKGHGWVEFMCLRNTPFFPLNLQSILCHHLGFTLVFLDHSSCYHFLILIPMLYELVNSFF